MDSLGTLCALLDEKKKLFLQYEKATQELLSCGADAMENYIIQRERLANDIDERTEKIARICDGLPGGDLLPAVAAGRAAFSGVPDEYHCVFYSGQELRSIISRIAETEKQAMERLKQLRNQALEGVRLNKEMPKIKRYLTGLTEQPVQGSLRDGKA